MSKNQLPPLSKQFGESVPMNAQKGPDITKCQIACACWYSLRSQCSELCCQKFSTRVLAVFALARRGVPPMPDRFPPHFQVRLAPCGMCQPQRQEVSR